MDKQREEFEKWAAFNGMGLYIYTNLSKYADSGTEAAWQAWQAAQARAVPDGFVLVEREKLAMIFETATNALVYHATPPKHDALSIIQGIARKAMIEAQGQAND